MSSNLSFNSINKFLTNDKLWIFISILLILFYLSPLLITDGNFYVPVYDNLDSNVVWYKILAESGMIFANNNEIIPNMMNGLPRSSYPGEFNVILWLYYFFTPITAYIINEVLIHLVAFISMFIFLKKYIVKRKKNSNNILIYIGSLYFALLPFWSGAGLSIAILPLVTYSLLNIKNNAISYKSDWILLTLLPLYTSFIFLYMFYIIIAGIYLIYDTLKNKELNIKFFLALFLMGTVFLLTEYRLVYSMFFDSGYISHRTEFDLFFQEELMQSYRIAHTYFLNGHASHAQGLQDLYVLPIILISMLLSLVSRRFNQKESILIWAIIILSFITKVWKVIITGIYTMPAVAILSIFIIIKKKDIKIFALLILFQILLAIIVGLNHYNGLEAITKTMPIFKALNVTRLSFVAPFIWTILIVISLSIIVKKLYYSHIFIVMFIITQSLFSFHRSYNKTTKTLTYASFEDYYAPELFKKVKNTIPEKTENIKVVSLGLEPAVLLYNGFYTVDGYAVNYSLEYKKRFLKVMEGYLKNTTSKTVQKTYNKWGSKMYLPSSYIYTKNIVIKKIYFNPEALCSLKTDYLISSNKVETKALSNTTLIKTFKGEVNSWDIYLYKLQCKHMLED